MYIYIYIYIYILCKYVLCICCYLEALSKLPLSCFICLSGCKHSVFLSIFRYPDKIYLKVNY